MTEAMVLRSPTRAASLRSAGGGSRAAAAMAVLTFVLLGLSVYGAGWATAAEDPGFAYVDNNNDHQFELGDGDIDVTYAQLQDGFDTDAVDGTYNPATSCGGGSCDGAGLVMPPSVNLGTITIANQPGVSFIADGDLVVGVHIVDGGGFSDVSFISDDGSVLFDDPVVRSEGNITIQAPNGDVVARADQFVACADQATISVVADGLVDLSYTNVRADGVIFISSTTNGVELVGSVVGTAASGGTVDVGANGDAGTIDATDAFIESDAPGTPELNGDGTAPYTNGTVITTGATIAHGQLQCEEQVITEPPTTTTGTTTTATTTTGTTTTGTTTTGTTTTATTTTGTTTTGTGTTTTATTTTGTGTTTTGTTTTATTTTGTGTTTTGTTSTSSTSATSTSSTTPAGASSSTTSPALAGGQQSTGGGDVGGETAFTGAQNVIQLAAIALGLLTTGSGLVWVGGRSRRSQGRDDDMWLRR